MLWLAQICLMAQIILAPILLGGLRPWALGILAILTGIGILAVCVRPGLMRTGRYLGYVWLTIGAIIGWSIIQSLPVWPVQPYPFDLPRIALAPYGWQNVAPYLIWLGGLVTLTTQVAHMQPRLFIIIARTIVITCTLQLVLATSAELMGWQTTFWFAKQAHSGDWTGSFANRNAFGTLMGFGMVACLFLYDQNRALSIAKRLDHAGGWLALAIVFTVAVIQSHSRLAFVMAVIGGGLFMIQNVPIPRHRLIRSIFILLAGVVISAVAVMASPELLARFTDLGRADLIQRDDVWATALHGIAARPVTGWGANAIALVMAHFSTPDLNANAHWFSSHNLWLDGALVFGIPVMVITFCLGCIALKALVSLPLASDIRALVIAFLVMALAESIGDWVMIMPALILPVAMMTVATFATGFAARRATPLHAGHVVQPPAPDQAT
ncbi:O-antigen ligase family protein [Thalassospira sp.]|uniref:O-antigen ligase family protein n=1 Tax=Thalassospira sp. TaxID=1912094 RepID=UPI003AA80BF1